MRLLRLIYYSRPFDYDEETLRDILGVARRHNRLRGITGALLCRADLFVQLLEGPREPVTRTFARILDDDRHSDVALAWCGDVDARLFPGWEMRADAPHVWMWTPEQVALGAAREAHSEDFVDMFRWLASEPQQAPLFGAPPAGGVPQAAMAAPQPSPQPSPLAAPSASRG